MKPRSEVHSVRLKQDDIDNIAEIARALHTTRTFVGKIGRDKIRIGGNGPSVQDPGEWLTYNHRVMNSR